MDLHIITRCFRPENLFEIKKEIHKTELFKVQWWVIFDISRLKKVDTQTLKFLNQSNIHVIYFEGKKENYGSDLVDEVLKKIDSGWIYLLDDDNQIHHDFFEQIYQHIVQNPNSKGFIFNQLVSGKDFTGLDIRVTEENDVEIGKIDTAQFLLRRDLIGNTNYNQGGGYISDGIFIKEIFENNKKDFVFIDKILSHYNFFQKNTKGFLPKVILIGSDEDLKTHKYADFESDEIRQLNLEDDSNIDNNITDFDPDAIITIGQDFGQFPKLSYHSLDIRRRWLHFSQIDENVGEASFRCAMNYIISADSSETPLVSFFTPTYNTGEVLWRTFRSLQNQTWTNWEWVIVDDSKDSGETLEMAESMSKIDCRVKVYSFHKKSGGIIGESKWRAASLCRGKWLIELDHDDCVTPDAAELCVKAFKDYPDCKFVYSDCVEVDQWENSLTYGEGFAFGYGSYKDTEYAGKKWQVANTPNINPKTIRHIVGVPNHFRAWEREFYFSIGGHNRRLSIADDYELIVRTFLKTRMVRIPKMLYIQYYHGSNSQNPSRSDIQRRVRWISSHYNEQIRRRFSELGLRDWAWESNPQNPTWVESRFGDSEERANYIMNLDITNFDWSNSSNVTYNFQI